MIEKVAAFLNHYGNAVIVISNVLLVVLTGIYVWLTGRSLSALKLASLREREARHLQEIKDHVIIPITLWISNTALHRYKGKSPQLLILSGGFRDVPRTILHSVDDPFTALHALRTPADSNATNPVETWTSTESDRVSKYLYGHAKRDHFPAELSEFDQLLEDLRELTGDVVRIANDCVERAVNKNLLPSLSSEDENSANEWVNYHQFVMDCVHCFLVGTTDPVFAVQAFGNFFRLTSGREERLIGKSADAEKLKTSQVATSRVIRERWDAGQFDSRIRDFLVSAEGTRRDVERILFTHSLGVDCELVGGETQKN